VTRATKEPSGWAPDHKVRCIDSFAGPGGLLCRRGEELRANHPAVRLAPSKFVTADTLPDEEPLQEIADYSDAYSGSAGEIRIVPRTPIEESVWCREDFRAGGVTFRGGTPYPRSHPLVLAHAAMFDIRTSFDQVLAEGGA